MVVCSQHTWVLPLSIDVLLPRIRWTSFPSLLGVCAQKAREFCLFRQMYVTNVPKCSLPFPWGCVHTKQVSFNCTDACIITACLKNVLIVLSFSRRKKIRECWPFKKKCIFALYMKNVLNILSFTPGIVCATNTWVLTVSINVLFSLIWRMSLNTLSWGSVHNKQISSDCSDKINIALYMEECPKCTLLHSWGCVHTKYERIDCSY